MHKSLLEVVNDLKTRKNKIMELDNLHFDFSQIDGYNKAFNMVIILLKFMLDLTGRTQGF